MHIPLLPVFSPSNIKVFVFPEHKKTFSARPPSGFRGAITRRQRKYIRTKCTQLVQGLPQYRNCQSVGYSARSSSVTVNSSFIPFWGRPGVRVSRRGALGPAQAPRLRSPSTATSRRPPAASRQPAQPVSPRYPRATDVDTPRFDLLLCTRNPKLTSSYLTTET